ncbi:hypothetical protein FACS189430_11580 [Bacteroidia bacterium]|nr:hypothetical protein FACS189430_11580 [Bacteroidia bacterium]
MSPDEFAKQNEVQIAIDNTKLLNLSNLSKYYATFFVKNQQVIELAKVE